MKTKGHCIETNYVYFSSNTKKSSFSRIRENTSIFSFLAATYRGNTAFSFNGNSVYFHYIKRIVAGNISLATMTQKGHVYLNSTKMV